MQKGAKGTLRCCGDRRRGDGGWVGACTADGVNVAPLHVDGQLCI